jgi:hypothetical protein
MGFWEAGRIRRIAALVLGRVGLGIPPGSSSSAIAAQACWNPFEAFEHSSPNLPMRICCDFSSSVWFQGFRWPQSSTYHRNLERDAGMLYGM